MEMSLYCVGGERISATYKGRRCRSNSGEHSCNNVTDRRIHRRWVEFYSQFCWRCNENDYCSYKVRVNYTSVCMVNIFKFIMLNYVELMDYTLCVDYQSFTMIEKNNHSDKPWWANVIWIITKNELRSNLF